MRISTILIITFVLLSCGASSGNRNLSENDYFKTTDIYKEISELGKPTDFTGIIDENIATTVTINNNVKKARILHRRRISNKSVDNKKIQDSLYIHNLLEIRKELMNIKNALDNMGKKSDIKD